MAYLKSLLDFFSDLFIETGGSMAPLVIFCLLKNIKRRDRLPTPVFLGFPCGSAGKEYTCNVGDLGSIPGLGRLPGEGERLPIPVFWPGEFHGLYSPWGHKESDTTKRLSSESSL